MTQSEEGSKIVQQVKHNEGTIIAEQTNIKNVYMVSAESKPQKPRLPFEPETVQVPSGPFTMGDDNNPLAAPQHSVDLPVFHIGIYPVTNAQFAEFVWQTGRVAAKELLWNGNQPTDEQTNAPVAGVTWYEALEYCQWLSEQSERAYSLPNEAQWEKAARGPDGGIYPWGETWDETRCHRAADLFAAVDAYEAQSAYGCFDLVGNAREWTCSLWGTTSREPDARFAYPWTAATNDPKSTPSTVLRVFRGGRGREPSDYACSQRRGYSPEQRGPRRNRIGFRVAMTSEQSE